MWSGILPRIGFCTHARHAPVEIRRFATGASAEIGLGTEKVRTDTTFRADGKPAGLGARFAADGVVPDKDSLLLTLVSGYRRKRKMACAARRQVR
jgi:hypothetical protein